MPILDLTITVDTHAREELVGQEKVEEEEAVTV